MLERIQLAYEEMRAYFTQPGAVIARTSNGCVYRTWNQEKCAVGVRLPDAWVEARGRGAVNGCGGLEGLFETFPEVEQFIGHPDTRLYQFHQDAQGCHDISTDAAEFVIKLDVLAEQFGLNVFIDVPEAVQAPAELVLA
jgi:hypothetical protein